MIERCPQFLLSAGPVASEVESHCHVEVIIGIAGIVLNGFLEVVDSFLLTASRRYNSEVVIDLGQRQSRGNEFKGTLGFCEISVSVCSEAEIEICFARDGGSFTVAILLKVES